VQWGLAVGLGSAKSIVAQVWGPVKRPALCSEILKLTERNPAVVRSLGVDCQIHTPTAGSGNLAGARENRQKIVGDKATALAMHGKGCITESMVYLGDVSLMGKGLD
jgi:hypothetical protein